MKEWYGEEGGREKMKEWYSEEGGREKMKKWYDEEGGREKMKEWYGEEGGREKMKEWYEAHTEEVLRKQKEYYAGDGKEKKKEWYNQNRQNRLEYATTYYKKQDKIKKILSQHFHFYDSGMEFVCISCTRLHSRSNVTRHRHGEKDDKLLLLPKTKNMDEHYYICTTCKPYLRKETLPLLHFSRTSDFNRIGSIPNCLPDLNVLESYLLKINIPFIRVSHVPRSPNLKLVGGSVCIEADINHTVRRLQINPETIIPVSFKRKLSYTGRAEYFTLFPNKIFGKSFHFLVFFIGRVSSF